MGGRYISRSRDAIRSSGPASQMTDVTVSRDRGAEGVGPRTLTDRAAALLERLVRFGLVGGFATAIQYVVLIALVRKAGMWPPVASVVGFVLSAGVNYLLNYHVTFRSDQQHAPAATKFLTLAIVGLGLNATLMQVLVDVGWHYLLAQVCVTAVVFLWNFVGNSLWTFRAYTGP